MRGVEGTTLGTILGRFRRLRGPRHRALRVAGNTPVQGEGRGAEKGPSYGEIDGKMYDIYDI
jgi:hypothetical protein